MNQNHTEQPVSQDVYSHLPEVNTYSYSNEFPEVYHPEYANKEAVPQEVIFDKPEKEALNYAAPVAEHPLAEHTPVTKPWPWWRSRKVLLIAVVAGLIVIGAVLGGTLGSLLNRRTATYVA
jgi:hypothetical protein